MTQEQGMIGRLVGTMIRRSVRQRYRNVHWRAVDLPIHAPAILYANHHGWMDGYLMFHLCLRLDLVCVDWIEEFDTFPLFRHVGGMPYRKGDVANRVATVRATIHEMANGRSLVLFPEGVMHRPPDVLPCGKALATIARRVSEVSLVPVAIVQEMSLHERPEAWLSVGVPHRYESLAHCEATLAANLQSLREDVRLGSPFDVLARGTPSVNERLSLKRFQKR